MLDGRATYAKVDVTFIDLSACTAMARTTISKVRIASWKNQKTIKNQRLQGANLPVAIALAGCEGCRCVDARS